MCVLLCARLCSHRTAINFPLHLTAVGALARVVQDVSAGGLGRGSDGLTAVAVAGLEGLLVCTCYILWCAGVDCFSLRCSRLGRV